MSAKVNNAKGTVYFGMHFYPGVARYEDPSADPYTIFLNENTLREMDKSFAGRPVYVQHVDGVNDNLDELRKEADGWVVESFYNSTDGKHWVRFIVCSERGEEAIKRGFRLSNSYMPTKFGADGMWNGVRYDKEVTGGEYDHLALVSNPRYEESIILSPEAFKKYNDDKAADIKRLNNEGSKMKFSFFKRAKVENSDELASMLVQLPKSGGEAAISKLIEDADDLALKIKNGDPMYAHDKHLVKVGENTMTVKEMKEKYNAMCEDKSNAKEEGAEEVKGEPELNSEDEAKEEKEEKKENDADGDDDGEDDKKEKKAAADEKKKNSLAKADALRDAAYRRNEMEVPQAIDTSDVQVARGKARYGSK